MNYISQLRTVIMDLDLFGDVGIHAIVLLPLLLGRVHVEPCSGSKIPAVFFALDITAPCQSKLPNSPSIEDLKWQQLIRVSLKLQSFCRMIETSGGCERSSFGVGSWDGL